MNDQRVLTRDRVVGNHHVIMICEPAERRRAVLRKAHPVPQLECAMVGPGLEEDGRGADHHGLRLLRIPRLAYRAVRVHCRGALRLYPPLQAVQMDVLDRAGALARVDERVSNVALLVANVALRGVLQLAPSLVVRPLRVLLSLRGAPFRALDCRGLTLRLLVKRGERRHVHRDIGGGAHLGHEHIRLAETEHVTLAQPPRDEPCAAHSQLEEDVAAVAWEAGCAAAWSVCIDDRIEPERAILALVANEGSTSRKLPVSNEYGRRRRGRRLLSHQALLFAQVAGSGNGVQRGTGLIHCIVLLEDTLLLL
mmetsp:Transcript_42524/g.111954  ORF Transcript_42524/g.111954 Transcript_42524/m.111954 type:complete len:309 (-) Transcript_42524:107-1033(-)